MYIHVPTTNNTLTVFDTRPSSLYLLYLQLFSRLPDVSIECSSNVVHFRTCVDSCTALRDLVLHLASHGDLQPPPLEEPLLVRTDYCGSSSGLTPTDSLALSAQVCIVGIGIWKMFS